MQARSRGVLKLATSAVDATTGAATFHAARRDGILEAMAPERNGRAFLSTKYGGGPRVLDDLPRIYREGPLDVL